MQLTKGDYSVFFVLCFVSILLGIYCQMAQIYLGIQEKDAMCALRGILSGWLCPVDWEARTCSPFSSLVTTRALHLVLP